MSSTVKYYADGISNRASALNHAKDRNSYLKKYSFSSGLKKKCNTNVGDDRSAAWQEKKTK